MDYFTEQKEIVIKTENGRKLKQECRSTTPDQEKFDAIRKAKQTGKASFKDVAKYKSTEEFKVVKAKLYYDGEKVGERKLPPIKIREEDMLEVTFELQIVSQNGRVEIQV